MRNMRYRVTRSRRHSATQAGKSVRSGTRTGGRERSGAGARRTGVRRFLTRRRIGACVLSLLAAVAAAFTVLYNVIDIPRPNEQAEAESNVYLYRDGTRLARTGDIDRESVSLKKVPKGVRYAFVAAEDMSFYDSPGINPLGMARGLFNTLSGKSAQGGSTITQQYVKNYYLSQEQTLTRKVKEMVISLKVDRRLSKNDILAGYLNTNYFGRLAYGIQAASHAYYGKDVEDLTVAEGAYLAALVQAPSQYDWTTASPESRQLVKQRWKYVLDNMTKMGVLSPAERRHVHFRTPHPPKSLLGLDGHTGYLVDAANRELIASGVDEQRLAAGGWTIRLTIDPKRQRALERAVEKGKRGTHGGGSPAAPADTQTGAVSVSPRTGKVLALYGGRDYAEHYLSNATRSDYQAGDAFVPLNLAGELTRGRTARTKGGSARAVKRTAVDLGMDPDASGFTARPRTLSKGLMGTSALELAGVYAAFDNDGRKVSPAVVSSARRGTESATLPPAVGDKVIGAGTARKVLAKASDQQASPKERTDGPVALPAAAQGSPIVSGTSDDKKAAWCVGFTHEAVTTVGTFGEDAKTRRQRTLGRTAKRNPETIWSTYTGAAPHTGKAAAHDRPGPR